MSTEAPLPTELSLAPAVVAPENPSRRSRLPLFGGPRRQHPELDRLLRTLRKYHPKADARLVERAYETAAYLHREQRRRSGDAYITHPVAVAEILADLGMGGTTLAAALLHDTIEDTETTEAEIRAEFGEKVASIVMEVTDDKSLPKAQRKLLQIEHAAHSSHEAKLVKLADKICNLRDMLSSPPSDWPLNRRLEYFVWAGKVIDGVRGTNSRLEQIFEDLMSKSSDCK